MRRLVAVDAILMADIHAASFPKGWNALEMSAHCAKDACYGYGDPLSAFVICRIADHEAEILTLATDPQSRRQGLGGELLKQMMDQLQAEGVEELFLDVAEDNLAAQKLYKTAGFVPIGRRPGYYRRPTGRMAALTFSKKLDAEAVAT